MANYKQLLRKISTFIFDVDGVMTNGIVLLTPDGDMLRSMNVKDGYALQLAVRKGYRIVIISGGNSESVRKRFTDLGVTDIFLAVGNKLQVYEKFISESGTDPDTVLYMGDDIPDYKVMEKVGVAACPADAREEIKSVSAYISSAAGGYGCVRDVIEQVMKLQGTWFDDDGFHW